MKQVPEDGGLCRVPCSASLLTTLLPTVEAECPGPSSDASVDPGFPPVTCVIADGLLPWAIDTAEEFGMPALAFCTASACSFLAYLSVPKLFDFGELPFPAGGSLDEPVRKQGESGSLNAVWNSSNEASSGSCVSTSTPMRLIITLRARASVFCNLFKNLIWLEGG
ncbi:linamarin synthase 2-like [Miscanthus floridulus]|uniref:linamarin synthase 2-like n=1 Tax=Miscanthus floridulus TaxID=154761 RepID=UPI0034599292